MKKAITGLFSFVILMSLNSCFVNTEVPKKEDILKNICLHDNSTIGLLNFCNFSGTVENKNSFKVNNLEIKGTFYNKDTKQRTYYQFKVDVPITTYGSATYQNKIFVGKHTSIEKVEVVFAEKCY